MTRELAVLIMIGSGVLILGLLAWGWWFRARRDAGLHAPFGEFPEGTAEHDTMPALYVATTRHGEPLERLAIRGLTFRSRVDVTVTDGGVALDLTGKPRVIIRAAAIVAVDQATVAIDRVVEKDGLVRIAWHLDADTIVDSYLRPQETSARALAEAITKILPASATAGGES